MKLFILGIAIFVILSYQSIPPECSKDIDCKTPYTFLLRSNCPFTSVCDNHQCMVVCESAETCKRDSDCTCSHYAAEDLKKCSCMRSTCTAVVAE